MIKLKVGMYVRTPLGISKYLGYYDNESELHEFDKLNEELWSGDIYGVVFDCEMEGVVLKASHNIIDLIEAGDYVNGYKVEDIEDKGKFKILIIDIGSNREHILYDCFIEDGSFLEIREEQIKTILTHEVFEREVYKV